MSRAPEFLFSHRMPGMIWNTLSTESAGQLLLEVRDDVNFLTTFSLLDYKQNIFLFQNLSLPERWWVSIAAANPTTVLINRFMNRGGNPDQKSLIAVDVASGTVRWEREAFSFFDWNDLKIYGYRTDKDSAQAMINIVTGEITDEPWTMPERQQSDYVRPDFYPEGHAYFDTIKKFLSRKDYSIVKGVEYLEFQPWIIASVYVGEPGKLANYLLVFHQEGTLALSVKLGENLAGLGADTFFILSGCLFLVQNKTDLAAYRL